MKLVALMLARNSEWIIGASARAALRWCDGLVVLDHASTDNTAKVVRQVQEEHGDKVVLLREDNPVWDEMNHRQRTLDAARVMFGATHVANVDDDEIATCNRELDIRAATEALQPGEALKVPWISMWGGLDTYRDDDSAWSRSQVHLAFALTPQTFYRAAADGYQHHSRRPRGDTGANRSPFPYQRDGGLMHFQFSSARRLKAKQALYKLNELIRWPGRMTPAEVNRMYDNTTLAPGLKMAPVPAGWWAGLGDLRSHINLDAEPWQEAEVKRLLAIHGAAKFAGLDLYGVA